MSKLCHVVVESPLRLNTVPTIGQLLCDPPNVLKSAIFEHTVSTLPSVRAKPEQ
jgi:hypothetical protein